MAAEPEREDVEVSVSFYELYKVPGVKWEVRFYYPVVRGGLRSYGYPYWSDQEAGGSQLEQRVSQPHNR